MSHQSPSRKFIFLPEFDSNDSTSFLKHGSHNDQAGEGCGQTDQCVNDLQYHIRAASVSC